MATKSFYSSNSSDSSDDLSLDAIRMRIQRQKETPDQRKQRLLRDRERKRQQREQATADQRQRTLEYYCQWHSEKRMAETPEQRIKCLLKIELLKTAGHRNSKR